MSQRHPRQKDLSKKSRKGLRNKMDISIELDEVEVIVLTVALATVPMGPPPIEETINRIAQKILDAQDLASIPTL
jgi:hypothetical protein